MVKCTRTGVALWLSTGGNETKKMKQIITYVGEKNSKLEQCDCVKIHLTRRTTEKFNGDTRVALSFGLLGIIFLATGIYFIYALPVNETNGFIGFLMLGWFAVAWMIFGLYVTVNGFRSDTRGYVMCPKEGKDVEYVYAGDIGDCIDCPYNWALIGRGKWDNETIQICCGWKEGVTGNERKTEGPPDRVDERYERYERYECHKRNDEMLMEARRRNWERDLVHENIYQRFKCE